MSDTTPTPPADDATPPGATPEQWYPDPWGVATLRWWDGEQWTAHTHDSTSPAESPSTGTQRRTLLIITLAILVTLTTAGIALFVYFAQDEQREPNEARERSRPATSEASPDPTAEPTVDPTVEPTTDPTVEPTAGAPVLDASAGEELDERIAEMRDYYMNLSEDEIFELVPRTEDGYSYYMAFTFFLTDHYAATMFGPRTDPVEIQEINDQLTEVESKFLANEDLGFPVTYTGTDGETFYYDGSAPAPATETTSPPDE